MVKHVMVYLTITFLIVLLENFPDKNLYKIFSVSLYLYVIFIFISKTEYGFFIFILIVTAVIYILYLKRQELAKKEETASKKEKEEIAKKHDLIIKINNGLIIVVFILTIIGFFVYMGRKKFEYKNNFSYLTFIFGKIECKGTSSKIDYLTSVKHLFR
jgi:ABC-type Fe3+ transport system permease subunit